MLELLEEIKRLPKNESYVVVTLVNAARSVPQEVGAKMLITQQCSMAPLKGTIGGGSVEREAVEYALKLLADPQAKSELKFFHLKDDLEMACGGEVNLFFEIVRPRQWNIAIYGAGHVAQNLVPLLLKLDCHLHCFDSRQEWLDKLPEHSQLTKYILEVQDGEVKPFIKLLPENCYHLVMTYGHLLDLPVAQEILRAKKVAYLGIIGSRSKSKTLAQKLLAAGVDAAKVEQIYSPVGLPFGNNTPPEIAISIAAQLLAVRDGVMEKFSI